MGKGDFNFVAKITMKLINFVFFRNWFLKKRQSLSEEKRAA